MSTLDDWGELPGRLFVISGASGTGKSTLARRLVARPEVGAVLSVSATTREPRPGERDGVDYYFYDRGRFDSARERDEFLETAEVHGNYYGTPVGPVRELLASGRCVILEIDVQGGFQVRGHVPSAMLIFVQAPGAEALEARLRGRAGDDDATIRRRLANAAAEIAEASRYDVQVVNDDLDRAELELVALLQRSGCGGPDPDA